MADEELERELALEAEMRYEQELAYQNELLAMASESQSQSQTQSQLFTPSTGLPRTLLDGGKRAATAAMLPPVADAGPSSKRVRRSLSGADVVGTSDSLTTAAQAAGQRGSLMLESSEDPFASLDKVDEEEDDDDDGDGDGNVTSDSGERLILDARDAKRPRRLSDDSSTPAAAELISHPEPTLLSREPAEDSVAMITRFGGRAWARMYTEDEYEAVCASSTVPDAGRGEAGMLLGRPFESLLQELELDERAAAIRAADLADDQEAQAAGQPAARSGRLAPQTQLWVDKYAPKHYAELLSDERTNRGVLSWIKQWDPVVFPARTIAKAKARRIQAPPCETPDSKILLMAGPPGLGKTTLAHIAASTAGYRVMEINASSERTATVLKSRIAAAMQNTAINDARPTLLVLDEIDGVAGSDGKGVIDLLVQMVEQDRKAAKEEASKKNKKQQQQQLGTRKADADAAADDDDDDDDDDLMQDEGNGGNAGKKSNNSNIKQKKKGKAKTVRLRRPIICICNDLYAPALRSLRDVASVFVFRPPSTQALLDRLKYVSRKEGLSIDSTALLALCDMTENDVRSCLNTLMFLRARYGRARISKRGLDGLGQKDMRRSLFDVWQGVFSQHTSMPDLVKMLQSVSGQMDRLVIGLFENYPEIAASSDFSLRATVPLLDLLGSSDVVSQRLRRDQVYALSKYVQRIPIAFKLAYQTRNRVKIAYPRADAAAASLLRQRRNIILSLLQAAMPAARRGTTITSLAVDLIPRLLDILADPVVRPAAQSVLSERERHALRQLVSKYVAFGITWRAPRGSSVDDGMLMRQLEMDPPIHLLGGYGDAFPLARCHRELSDPQRLFLAQLINQARVREIAAASSATAASMAAVAAAAVATDAAAVLDPGADTGAATGPPPPSTPPKLQDQGSDKDGGPTNRPGGLHSTLVRPDGKVARDFFGRPILVSPSQEQPRITPGGSTLHKARSSDVYYKFNEGFTNAVRRVVRMRDLL